LVGGTLRSRAGLFAVSGAALLWGTAGVVVHVITSRTGLDAVPIGCYRLIFASVALLVLVRGDGIRRIRLLSVRHRWGLVLSGVGLGVYQALYFVGVQDVGVSVSTLVSLGVAPIAITAITSVSRRAWPAGRSLVTLICAVTGLAMVSLSAGSGSGPHPVIGVLVSVASGLGYAGYTLLGRRLVEHVDTMLLATSASVVGAVVLIPLAAVEGLAVTDGVSVLWLIYLGVFTTALAYVLFYAGLRSTPSEVAAVLTLLEPLAAAVLAVALLHERLSALGVVGALLMLVAIAVLYLRRPSADEHQLAPPAG
jgi:DME family drug/metabolite transporter